MDIYIYIQDEIYTLEESVLDQKDLTKFDTKVESIAVIAGSSPNFNPRYERPPYGKRVKNIEITDIGKAKMNVTGYQMD